MLALPEKGFQRSVHKHNVELDILTDWIEASIVFVDSEISRNDVVDVLHENTIYEDQDFAQELVGDAWSELERRAFCVGKGSSFSVSGRRVKRLIEWPDNVAYSFCVLLTILVQQKRWAKTFGSDYTTQGALFELLTVESLKYSGWTVFHTGWDPGNAVKIKQVVSNVCTHICEPEIPGEIEKWFAECGNEEQLDVVCSSPFPDGFGGRPIFLIQCASGANWVSKIHTPDPDSWRRVISFTTTPQRGFAIPFSLLSDEFRRRAGKVNGLFLDRFRLQHPAFDGNRDWVSEPLRKAIFDWMCEKVECLPDDTV